MAFIAIQSLGTWTSPFSVREGGPTEYEKRNEELFCWEEFGSREEAQTWADLQNRPRGAAIAFNRRWRVEGVLDKYPGENHECYWDFSGRRPSLEYDPDIPGDRERVIRSLVGHLPENRWESELDRLLVREVPKGVK